MAGPAAFELPTGSLRNGNTGLGRSFLKELRALGVGCKYPRGLFGPRMRYNFEVFRSRGAVAQMDRATVS
jgi:hypothetical protein